MVIHMKTTLNIDDSVMQRLREEAARRGKTMSELVEAGLRRVLEEPEQETDQVREHGIARIVTRDTDFHRFSFLEIVDPLRPA